MEVSVVSEMDKLIELQRIDNELMRIEELKGDLPERVREIKRSLQEYQEQLEEHTERLEEIEKEERKHEARIEDETEKVEKKQDQLYLVTTNKEYDSLTSEIEQVKNSIDEAEMRLVELSDEQDDLEESVAMEEHKVDELKEELERREAELQETIEKTEEEQAKLEEEREEIVQEISRAKLSKYNRIRNARGGLAVVPVVNDACGGCHQHIPPQDLVEIRTGDRLIPCEICGRFLYWPEEKQGNESE